jgi:hypothetical protein
MKILFLSSNREIRTEGVIMLHEGANPVMPNYRELCTMVLNTGMINSEQPTAQDVLK